jgi:hypothetical protein
MLRTSRILLVLFTLLFMLVMAGGAFAQSFDISWTGGYGPGTGILSATNVGTYFLVESLTGIQDGSPIGLLGTGAYGSNDNRLYFPPTELLFDSSGIAFADGSSNRYNIYDNGGLYYECISTSTNCEALGSGLKLGSLKITETPEPSTILLFLSGFGALLIVVARKFVA